MKSNLRHDLTMQLMLLFVLCIPFLLLSCKEQPIETFTLDNGLKVIVRHTDKSVAAFNIYLKGGVSISPADKPGTEIVLLRTLARASQKYDRKTMENMIDELQFSIDQGTSFDFSDYKLRAIDKYFVKSLDAFLETFIHPRLAQDDFEEARQVQINEVLNEERDPILSLFNNIIRVSFAGHPYAIKASGTVQSLEALTLEDIKNFYDQNWVGSRMFAVYVGNMKTPELKKILQTKLKQLPRGSFTMPTVPPLDKVLKTDFRVFEIPGMPNFHIRSNFPSIPYSHPDYFAANLAGSILGDLMGTTIRTWRGIAYTPQVIPARSFLASYGSHIVTGCSDVPTAVALIKECTAYIIDGVGRVEYRDENGMIITDQAKQLPERLVKTSLTDVLPQYKNLLITSYFSNLGSSQAQADQFALAEMNGLPLTDYSFFLEMIEKVTPQQIQNFAATYFQKDVFWSFGSSKENIEALSTDALSKIWNE